MKKIKNINQLKAEKKRIRQRREELEYEVQKNWKELKEGLRPVNIAKDAIGCILKTKMSQDSADGNILKTSFNYGVNVLAKRFADKAGKKLSKIFK